MILAAAGAADGHRLTRDARPEIARIDGPIVQHDVVSNVVDVVPDNHLAGRHARGLGENDCAPLMATTLIVTTPEPLGAGVGVVGVPPPLE